MEESEEARRVLEDAAATLVDMLTQLRVRTIVCVDDSYVLTQSVESIIGSISAAISESPRSQFRSVFPEIPFSVGSPWEEMIREWWDQAPVEDRRAKGLQIAAVLDQIDRQGAANVGELAVLVSAMGGSVQLRELTPEEWREESKQILEEASAEGRVLCLFDHNLSASGGSRDGGIELLRAVTGMKVFEDEYVYCALLSHTFTKDQEETKWRDLAREHELSLWQFLPIAKERLENPPEFVYGVKLSLINLACERLKQAIGRISKEGQLTALANLEDLTVRDFFHIVVESSQREGVWEADTLIRIYGLFERQEFIRQVHSPAERSSFEHMADLLVAVGGKDALRNTLPSPSVRSVRRTELWAGTEINAYFLPIDLGDLFETETCTFVLLAQPCDLAVRSDGKRRLRTGTLVPIEHVAWKEASDKRRYPHIYPECQYFLEVEDGNYWYYNFRGATEVLLDVLDLAVFQADGQCRFRSEDQTPLRLFKPWIQRFAAVRETFRELEERVLAVSKMFEEGSSLKQEHPLVVRHLLLGIGLGSEVVSPRYADGTFSFGLRRAGRLLPPQVTDLLAWYHWFCARSAFEPDYARLK